jgi:hypothetical protein
MRDKKLIEYKRVKIESTGNWKYEKLLTDENNRHYFVKPEKMPVEVVEFMDKSGVNIYHYDDKPGIPRCLFCEAPTSHQRYVTGVMIDLCDSHYYSKNIGKIVAELNKNGESHGIFLEKPKTGKQKVEPGSSQGEDVRRDPEAVGASGQGQRSEE